MPDLMQLYRNSIGDLFHINFGARPEERVLILADNEPLQSGAHPFQDRRHLVETAAAAAADAGLSVELMMYDAGGTHGTEPPLGVWQQLYGEVVDQVADDLWHRLLHKQADAQLQDEIRHRLAAAHGDFPDIILVLSHYSLSHTRFRNWTNELTGARIATMPTFRPEQLIGVMKADWQAVQLRSKQAAELLSRAVGARILSGDGLILDLNLDGRQGIADTGLLTDRGLFGNLPGGEGFIAPCEGTACGQFEAWGADGQSRLVFTVEHGLFKKVSDPDDPCVQSLVTLSQSIPAVANVAELGIGTNEAAIDRANILEGEKILGTCHIAFGDNRGFGGSISAPFHRDYIVPDPLLELDMGAGNKPVILLDYGRWNL